MPYATSSKSASNDPHELLAYIADLEKELDRLRNQCRLVHYQLRELLEQIQSLSNSNEDRAHDAVGDANLFGNCKRLAALLREIQEPRTYQPDLDLVTPIALKPLIEEVFRGQQRVWSAPHVVLRLDLKIESIEWFPSRLRYILENLISDAVRYRDAARGETRVTLACQALASAYELRLSDNGIGMTSDQTVDAFELLFLLASARAAGVGLAEAKRLIEQSGGTLTSDSSQGQGSSIVATLPRFDVDDYLEGQ
jgi:signal transduction histidine kinase